MPRSSRITGRNISTMLKYSAIRPYCALRLQWIFFRKSEETVSLGLRYLSLRVMSPLLKGIKESLENIPAQSNLEMIHKEELSLIFAGK